MRQVGQCVVQMLQVGLFWRGLTQDKGDRRQGSAASTLTPGLCVFPSTATALKPPLSQRGKDDGCALIRKRNYSIGRNGWI